MLSKTPEWFNIHKLVVYWQLSYLLAETYEEWAPMRDELQKTIDKGGF